MPDGLGLLCEHRPQEDQPCPCLAGSLLVRPEHQTVPKSEKRQRQVVSHKSEISLAFLTVTRVLRKVADFCSQPSALPVHRSTGSCNVCSGKERVNPESRWKATQLQKTLKRR